MRVKRLSNILILMILLSMFLGICIVHADTPLPTTPTSTESPVVTPTKTPAPYQVATTTPYLTPTVSPTPTMNVYHSFICELPDGESALPGGIAFEFYVVANNGNSNLQGSFIIEGNSDKFNFQIWMYPPMDLNATFKYKILTANTGYKEEDTVGPVYLDGTEIVFQLQKQSSLTDPPVPFTPTANHMTQPTENQTPTPYQFIDLDGFGWAEYYINSLSSSGVIIGYEGGKFMPENNITRAEFVKMLMTVVEIVDENYLTSYTDVPSEQWYYKYIALAEKEGLTKGNGDGTFTPDSYITREEMFTFNARAMQKYHGEVVLDNNDEQTAIILSGFKDGKSVSAWAKGFVATNIKSGYVTGSSDGNVLRLLPMNLITRAEVAVVIGRTSE